VVNILSFARMKITSICVDEVRSESTKFINRLNDIGIEVCMLTGDHQSVALKVRFWHTTYK
jgi:cation transport ATPase